MPRPNLRAFGTACLRAAGLSDAHAAQLADLLTNSDLRGVRSHGTRALYGYCCTLRDKKANPDPDIRILRESDTHVLVDGDGSLGYAPTMLATERTIAKAKEKGLAVGAACHIGHYGSAGHYVRRAIAENCVGFSVQAASPQYYPSKRRQARRPLRQPALVLWPARTRRAAGGARRGHLHPRPITNAASKSKPLKN